MMSEPIIESMLQQDFYKCTMADMTLRSGHADVPVRYEFRNRHRDRVRIPDKLDIGELICVVVMEVCMENLVNMLLFASSIFLLKN